MTDHSPVTASSANDVRLERYLLGLLDEPARDEVEAQAFTDPAVADALDEVETALVDAYVSKTLSAAQLEAFRSALDSRPRLQGRVRAARALAGRDPLPRATRWWLPVLGAAAALLLVASVWWLQRAAPPEPPPAQTASLPDAPTAETPTLDVTVPSSLTAPPDASPDGPSDAPDATPRAPARSVFAVTLPLGVSRATDILEIRVPVGSTHLQLRVPIAPGDEFTRYRVRLRGPGGQELGMADPAPLAPDRTVWLTVERKALTDALHEVAVEGLDAQGLSEPLTLQQVRVTTDGPRQ